VVIENFHIAITLSIYRCHNIFPFWHGNWSHPHHQCWLWWNRRCSFELYLRQWYLILLPHSRRWCLVPT